MNPIHLQKLEALLEPAVSGQGYDLVDLAFRRDHGHWVFQITIDRKEGQGFISHQDCINVSKEVSVLLDLNESLLPGDYHLEVSSPGPERPLKTKADFLRFQGQTAKIRLKEYAAQMIEGSSTPRRNFTGTLESVSDDLVTVKLSDNALLVSLPMKEIEKAHLFGNNK